MTAASSSNGLGFIVIGDYGTGLDGQWTVSRQMSQFARLVRPQPSFIISTGDQIYDHGWVVLLGRISRVTL